jgi:sigma-B regulation protein RsbU (phosphoserine phosphatase)
MWSFDSFIKVIAMCNQPLKEGLSEILEAIKTTTGSQIFNDDCSLIEINFVLE